MTKPKAILYARVSTPGQAENGYSLDQQIESLRQYAAEHELDVLEEVRDAGYSGATLNRPGIDHILEVVASGGVDVVLAQDADRITREPWHFGYLKAEFERYGTKLRALGDGDDETPEGEFFADIRRGMSKLEREYTKRRTRRGKARKVREGKLLGSGPPPYGFRWVQGDKGKRVGLEVDPETMPVVHRLFQLVGAHGLPMYSAAKDLERQGFYAPKGGMWRVSVVRNIVLNDVYKPHTIEELLELGVAGRVLAGLDSAQEYGVSWFGKRRTIGPARGPRTYRKVPRSEWIAVPVPSAGVPREWIESARDALRDNPVPGFLKESSRDHEVNGGLAVCGECGRNLTTHSTTTKAGTKHWYYVCAGARPRGPRKGEPRCQNRKLHPAVALEEAVVAYVDGELLTDPAELERHMDEAIAAEQQKIVGNTAWIESLARKIVECERQRAKNQQMFRADAMTVEELNADNARLDTERRAAEESLAEAQHTEDRVAEMKKAQRAVLELFGSGLMGGVYWFPPRLRRTVYKLLGMRVEVFADRTVRIEGEFDANLMRLTPEVERWVEGLREIDRRLEDQARENPPTDVWEGVDRIERELTALRRSFCAEAATRG